MFRLEIRNLPRSVPHSDVGKTSIGEIDEKAHRASGAGRGQPINHQARGAGIVHEYTHSFVVDDIEHEWCAACSNLYR